MLDVIIKYLTEIGKFSMSSCYDSQGNIFFHEMKKCQIEIKFKPKEKFSFSFCLHCIWKSSATFLFGYQTQNIVLSLLCFVLKHKMHCFLLLLLTKRHSKMLSVSSSKQFWYFRVNKNESSWTMNFDKIILFDITFLRITCIELCFFTNYM